MNSDKAKVFVSYSRADLPFPRNLQQTLTDHGYDVFLDLHDIAKGENWKQRLNSMLLESDVVVFVISSHWLASETCAWELQRTLEMGKRMAPLIHGPLDSPPPPRLAELNWTFSDELGPDSDVTKRGSTRPDQPTVHAIKALCSNLDHDTAWLREHSRWLVRANEWQEAGKIDDKLLRYGEIFSARQWAKLQPPNTPPLPEGMIEFFDVSEGFEAEQRNRLLTLTQKGFLGPAQRAVELNHFEAGLRLIAAAAILGEDTQLKRVPQFRELLSQVDWNLCLEGTITDANWYDFIDARNLIFIDNENTLNCLSIDDWKIHEIAPLSEHENLSVVDVRSANGEAVYTDRDGTAHRFTVAQGAEQVLESQPDHQPFVAARFLGDKGYALIASDGAIALVDRNTTSIRQWLAAPDLPEINVVISSSDGARLLTETHYMFDETPVRIWDTETGGLLQSITDQWKADFASSGQFVAAQDAYESFSEIKTIDKDRTDLLTHEKGTFDPKFSPCANWVVTLSRDHCVRLWKTKNGECIWQSDATGSMPTSVCFSSDSRQLSVGDEDGTITVYQMPSGEILHEIPNPLVSIQSLKCETNSDLLASRSTDGAVRIYRQPGTGLNFLIQPSAGPTVSRLSEAGGIFVKIDSELSMGSVYSVLSGAELFRFGLETDRLPDMAISPCERYLAILDDTAVLSLYSIPECSLTARTTLSLKGKPNLRFSPQGSYLLVSCSESDETSLYTTRDSVSEFTILQTLPGTACVFSENEAQCIVIARQAGRNEIRVYHTDNWEVASQIDTGKDLEVSSISILPGERSVALGVREGGRYGLQVWCLQAAEKRFSLGEDLEAAVRTIISIDRDRIIFTDQNGVTRLLDCQSLECSTIDEFDFVGQQLVSLEIADLVLVHGSDYVNSYGEDWIREGHSQIRLVDYHQCCCLQTWQQGGGLASIALCGWTDNTIAVSTRKGGLALIDFRQQISPTINPEERLQNLLSRGRELVTKFEQADFLMSGAPTSLAFN